MKTTLTRAKRDRETYRKMLHETINGLFLLADAEVMGEETIDYLVKILSGLLITRGLARRTKKSLELERTGNLDEPHEWEHVVPVTVISKIIKDTLGKRTPEEAHKMVDWYTDNAVQVYIPASIHKILNKYYAYSMPKDWDWKTDDIWARYDALGIDHTEFGD